MSGLSSRVMNMKFMKKDGDPVEEEEEVEVKKVSDSSSWALPNSTKILENAKPNVESVGYSSIQMYSDVTPVRRSWGSSSKDIKSGDDVDLGVSNLKEATNKKDKKKDKKSKVDKESSIDEQQKDTTSSKGKIFLQNLLDSKKRTSEYVPKITQKQKRLKN